MIFEFFFLNKLIFLFSRFFYTNQHIRIVNYHDTPSRDANAFEEQLFFYKKYYTNCDKSGLDNFFFKKIWEAKKPGLIITFDDGLRTNYDVALALLEKHGFTGWFCVPPDFIDAPIEQQNQYMTDFSIGTPQRLSKERTAMNWEELKDLLKRNHVITSHTKSHHRMKDEDTELVLDTEIFSSKKYLEHQLNTEIDIFCWVGGEEKHYTANAYDKIKASGYKYAFMTNNISVLKNTNTFQLQRTNIESHFPMAFVKFSLSGIYDLFYWSKRERVDKKIKFKYNN